MSLLILAPIIISSISLLVAAVTFYLTQLRPSQISVLIGPEIQVYHADFPETSTGMYIPMTFINSSLNMGTIFKSGISIFRKDSPEQRYFMLWRDFSKIGTDGNWINDTQAHAFAVNGKSSVSKTAWFMWLRESKPKLFWTQGTYVLVVHLWIGKDLKPNNFEFAFHISQEEEVSFRNNIQIQSKKVMRVLLNKDFERNRMFTIHESRALLD